MRSTFRGVSLALIAVFAFGALAAASASAKYVAEYPAFEGTEYGKHPVAFTTKSGAVNIQIKGGGLLQCTHSTGTGEIINQKEVAKVILKFEEGTCASYTTFCGQIGHSHFWESNELKGRIAYISKEKENKKEGSRIGLLLEPVTGLFAKCETPIGQGVEKIQGSILGEISPGSAPFHLGYTQSGGAQSLTHFEGEEVLHGLEIVHHSGEAAIKAGFEFREDEISTGSWPARVVG
jgi:hypothetical protein